MIAGARRQLSSKIAYVPLGLVAVAAALAALLLGIGGRRLVAPVSRDGLFAYALVTGFALLIAILWQWRLHFARRARDGRRIRREYNRHRWLGLLPVLLLVLHIGGPNASLMSIMSYALLASCLIGLFNQEVVRLRPGWARTVWLATHIGLAGVIVPLILLHLWASLAFRVE